MAEEKLDCRGMACPNPVLQAKQIIDRGDVSYLSVLVDNEAAKENVSRLLGRMGYEVDVVERQRDFEVRGTKGDRAEPCAVIPDIEDVGQARKIAVLIGTERLGRGDDVLGGKLLFNFIGTLKEMGADLWRLILLNGGVKLTVDGSESLTPLCELEKNGIHILVCGTCLGHFGLLKRKQVGETTNMLDIVTALQLADKVITVT